jgi:hypothetical protein
MRDEFMVSGMVEQHPLTIAISDILQQFARERAKSLGHEDVGAYVRFLIRQDQRYEALERLHGLTRGRVPWRDRQTPAQSFRNGHPDK